MPTNDTGWSVMRSNARRFGVWTLWLAFLSAIIGCTQRGPVRLDLDADVERPSTRAIIFFADGVHHGRLHELAEAGRLPTIRSRFIDGGVEVEQAFSSFPTITYPNCSAMLTGLFPGHHGILGNNWFDRFSLTYVHYITYGTYRDVNEHMVRPTLYDWLGDDLTVSVHAHTRPGVRQSIDASTRFGLLWGTGRYLEADAAVSGYFAEVGEIANRVKKWPRVILTYCPGVDHMGHEFGPDSPEYAESLENFDRVVARIMDGLAEAGLVESTYLVLISDHGMAPIEADQQIVLADWLADRRGMHLWQEPLDDADYVDRFERLRDYDGVICPDGGRTINLHLRGQRGWGYRPEPSEVYDWITAEPGLLSLPAVRFVLMREGPDRVRVLSPSGQALIERSCSRNGKAYRLVELESDPFGYLADDRLASFVRSGPHTSREWLEATAHTDHPDFVPQAVEMFDSPRTGDVIVFAAEGWGICENVLGGHGSSSPAEMRMPLFFAGPGLKGGTKIPCGRVVDMAPTLMGLLGESQRLARFPEIDGVDLSDELLQAD